MSRRPALTHAEHVPLGRCLTRVHGEIQHTLCEVDLLRRGRKVANRLVSLDRALLGVRADLDSAQQLVCTQDEHEAQPFPYFGGTSGTPQVIKVAHAMCKPEISCEQRDAFVAWLERVRADLNGVRLVVSDREGIPAWVPRQLARMTWRGGGIDRVLEVLPEAAALEPA